jgi:hypothetical protein
LYGNRQYSIPGGIRVYELEVIYASIPFTWYNVKLPPHETAYVRFSEPPLIVGQIPPGGYTATAIGVKIGDVMTTLSVLGRTYSCSVNRTTNRCTVTETSIAAPFDLIVPSVFSELLGFDPAGTYTGASTYTGPYSVFLDKVENIAIKMTVTGQSYSGEADNGILTNVSDFNLDTASGNNFAGEGIIIAVVAVDENYGGIIKYKPEYPVHVVFQEPIKDYLELDIFDRESAVDLNGLPWECKMRVWYEYSR